MERSMRGDDLAQFLQVGRYSLASWTRAGVLPVDDREKRYRGPQGHPLFAYSTISKFLQAFPNHPDARKEMPELMELLVLAETLRMPALLTCDQARKYLKMNETELSAALRKDLPSIRLAGDHGTIRICLTWIIDYAEQREEEIRAQMEVYREAVTAGVASAVLGVRFAKISQLAPDNGSGPLVRLIIGGALHVTRTSLLAFIGDNVNTGTAQEWWDLREAHNFEPLVTFDQVCQRFHIGAAQARQAVTDGLLLCLYVPGETSRISRIPQHAADTWGNTYLKLSNNEVGRIFGVAGWIVGRKWSVGAICPRFHERHITRSCLIPFIEANRTGEFDAQEWLRTAEQLDRPTVPLSELPNVSPGLTPAKINRALARGTLRGVHLPNGEIAVLSADIEK